MGNRDLARRFGFSLSGEYCVRGERARVYIYWDLYVYGEVRGR